jgi:hypothetical protein
MWLRAIMIGFCSLTASSLLLYQGIEVYHAVLDMFRNK